jgi:hypothetical protein
MDPNNQQPPPNQPPQGSAPGWGAPPPPAGPPGIQPGWGAPPPPAGPPGFAPGWGPAPAAPARRGVPRLLIVVGVVALLVVVLVVLAVLRSGHADAGKVVFTSDQPTSTGAQTCDVGTRVTSIKVGAPVYAVYFFSHRLAATDTVNLELIKDGTSISSNPVPSTKTSDADCLEAFQDISATLDQPGKYEIKLTVGGETVSDGTLTITP